MMTKVCILLAIPIMLIATLLLKPVLIGGGIFMTSLLLEVFVIAGFSNDDNQS